MKRVATGLFLMVWAAVAEPVPETLVREGIPPVPAALREKADRYLESRGASFLGWHPTRREMLVATRFADTPQLHAVRMPGGARRQLTFFDEPVRGGGYRPVTGECVIFSRDTGGGEQFQLYRLDLADGRTTLLTDGTSRNLGGVWSKDGRRLAYVSFESQKAVVWVQDVATGNRRVLADFRGSNSAPAWSPDGRLLASLNENMLHAVWVWDVAAAARALCTSR